MSDNKNRKIVVAQLSGGNDYLNCVVPYNNPLYYDNRPLVNIPQDRVIPLDDDYGLNPSMQPIKELYDQGKVAIIHGTGYPVPNRSHFRSMDIWHTAEPTTVALEGWLGLALKQMDPKGESPVMGVNFGAGLSKAMAAPGVPVACVGSLDSYGLMTHMQDDALREKMLDVFKNIYAQAIGSGPVYGLPDSDRSWTPCAAPTSSTASCRSTLRPSSTPPTLSPSR